MDRRRRPFVAVDLMFPFKNTCERLEKEFGYAGPLAFLYLIMAAKRAPTQGEVVFTSDADFWSQLGFHTPPEFTMDEFLAFTGRLKQTSKTPLGRTKNVILTHFGEWQKLPDTEFARQRSSRKRAQNTRDETRTKPALKANGNSTERRGEDASTSTYGITPRETKAAGGSTVGSATALRNGGETPQAFVQEEGWELDPGPLAAAIIARFPELDDLEIVNLVKLGDTIGRERSLA